VGESCAEIFAGNSLMLGLPCVQVSGPDLAQLRAAAEDATAEFSIDLESQTVSTGRSTFRGSMPEATRTALISGAWDATGMLLADYDQVQAAASRLPYIAGF
jgi:3-isopropylmalate/(R)-2-methylmalate dehydratase small subunit